MMPSEGGGPPGTASEPPLTRATVADHIAASCALASPAPTVGAEVEWLVVDPSDPQARPTVETLEAILSAVRLPGASRVTYEPGGQLELSGPPGCDPAQAIQPLAEDARIVRAALAERGLSLMARAHDEVRPPRRVNHRARYGAMEGWFVDGGWTTAPEMMCNTAAVQVNVGCGPDPAVTWQRANRWAPVLAAAFASSPSGGWASGRLRAWAGLDPSRTDSALHGGDPVDDWVRYALEARAMLRVEGQDVARTDGRFTFGQWVDGAPAGPSAPTRADLELHLTTLFPPVRLKGWMEVRVVDVPADEGWPVPVAVIAAILCGPSWGGEDQLLDLVAGHTWRDAARSGLADPALATAAQGLADEAAARLEAERSPLASAVARWAEALRSPSAPSAPSSSVGAGLSWSKQAR